jgi:hypothetical protein
MDVYRLEQPSYTPDLLLEGFSSKIWTERFIEDGEFELRTPKILEMREALPVKSLITLRDSLEVMMVETHSVEKDDDFGRVLVIKGRSVTSFLENRWIEEATLQTKFKMARTYLPNDAAAVLIWNYVVNPTSESVDRANVYGTTSRNVIPNVAVSDSSTTVGIVKRRWLQAGPIPPMIVKFLIKQDMGLRMVRPRPGQSAEIVSVTTSGTKGIVSKQTVSNPPQMRFDIYNGVDRSNTIQFSTAAGDISTPEYLWSNRNEKTVVLAMSSLGGVWKYRDPDVDWALEGFNRRVMMYDAGVVPSGTDVAEFMEDLIDFADDQLAENDKVEQFSGEVLTTSPWRYGTHYFLGDKVTLMGEYGFEQVMKVTEYIRTEDLEGEKGYPGLALVQVIKQ